MPDRARILIVEDETIIAMDLQDTLIDTGYAVVATLPSGEAALSHCAATPPDLVLMDIHLQGELTGLETARLLRERFAIPSVLLTAFFDPEMLRLAQQAGVFAYLIKPYDERELSATLATALTRAREEQGLRKTIQELRTPSAAPAAPEEETLKIRTFGTPLLLELNGRILSGDDLSRMQKEMLALLLASPNLKIDREVLEAELWPESNQERARAALDTTLSRLRKLLKDATGTQGEKSYFCLRNSIVSLEHTAVDHLHFHHLDLQARELRKHGNDAEAALLLEDAVALWDGEFLAGLSNHDDVVALRRYTTRRLFDHCLWLADRRAHDPDCDERIELLQRALRAEPASEKAMGRLYALLLVNDRYDQAKSLLKEFEQALIRDGLTRNEITQTLRRLEQKAQLERCTRSG